MTLYNPASLLNINPTFFVLIILWSLVWKGLALWKSARKKQPIWFILLLVLNTLGILEILYMFIFSKINPNGIETIKSPSLTKKVNSTKKKKSKKKS